VRIMDTQSLARKAWLRSSFKRAVMSAVGLLLSFPLWPGNAMACTSTPMTATPATGLALSGAADRNPVGQQIGGWGGESSNQVMFDLRIWPVGSGWCNGNTSVHYAFAEPLDPVVAGVTYIDPANGKQYPVYESGVTGIGYIVGIRDFSASSLATEMPLSGRTQTYPFTGGSTSTNNIGYRARVLFIATGRLASGSYTIPSRNIARFSVTNNNTNDVPGPTYLILGATQITIKVNGCQVTSSTRDQTIRMPTVNAGASDLASVTAAAHVGLQCDPGVSVYATMSDANHPDNTGDVLLPSSSSQVQGLGLQLSREETPEQFIRFGPDSSMSGNPNQWFVCNSESGGVCAWDNGVYMLKLLARYKLLNPVTTNGHSGYTSVTPGEFDAAATVTFSYQ